MFGAEEILCGAGEFVECAVTTLHIADDFQRACVRG